MNKLQNRLAIVTGTSRQKGIGAAICRSLAAEGADIFATYWTPYDVTMPWGVTPEEPLELQKEIRDLGVRCELFEIDLSIPYSYLEVLNAAERFGTPSILVNNACYSTNDGLDGLDVATLDAHYAINVRATSMLCVEFARRFPLGTGGRIINLTSGQSLGPMPEEIAYAITKGTVETLTRTLSAAVAHKGITVNTVNPGPTDTGWMTEELQHELAPRFPMGRAGLPSDAARLITFLATDDAAWITGQVIHSEGGFRR